MREQVHNNWVRRDEIAVVPKKQENEAVEDRENQVSTLILVKVVPCFWVAFEVVLVNQ